MIKLIDLAGQRFGRLVVTGHAGTRGISRNHYWTCACDCGAAKTVQGTALRDGTTRSCGCLQRETARAAGDRTRTHGMSKSTTYIIWKTMIQRCTNPHAKDYGRYGARGITVCEQWRTFNGFLADMGERPAGLTLDRRGNDGNYEPGNCRWVTATVQNRNQRSNVFLEHAGQRLTIAEWAQRTGINPITLQSRVRKYGWDVQRALTTPVQRVAS